MVLCMLWLGQKRNIATKFIPRSQQIDEHMTPKQPKEDPGFILAKTIYMTETAPYKIGELQQTSPLIILPLSTLDLNQFPAKFGPCNYLWVTQHSLDVLTFGPW